ncbi:MAG: ribosomal RNA small subunit methyltransferase G [Candidatus Sericytochromatia bacterium]|nr:MAG: ribosomal RNA small subunit methyltransferase G [Candidatus Sericytochromatia bacterium]
MFQAESKNYLIRALDSLNINHKEINILALELFYSNLIDWNKNINLTRITEEKDFLIKHVIDSLTILKAFDNNKLENLKIIDIGTGPGFPSLPFWIFFPNNKITLLDSVKKKLSFIENTIIKLNKLDNFYNLENIEIVHSRAEDLAHNINYREKFDLSLNRAVASLNILIELNLPFLKTSSFMLAMKSDKIEDEIKSSNNSLNKIGGKIEKIINFNLFGTDIKRNIILIKKIKKTLKTYPRKTFLIKEKPL